MAPQDRPLYSGLMTKLVLTSIGDDREGLVSALSAVVDDHGGNWLESDLSHLAGKFAGIILVDVPDDRAEDFTAALPSLVEACGLHVRATPAGDSDEGGALVHVDLVGQDHPGMVRSVSRALAAQNASILDFDSWTSDAPEGGGTLFQASLTVRLPGDGDLSAVQDELESIADELMVDLEFDEVVDSE